MEQSVIHLHNRVINQMYKEFGDGRCCFQEYVLGDGVVLELSHKNGKAVGFAELLGAGSRAGNQPGWRQCGS